MFNQNHRKAYVNPYRQGVLIGNYSEDKFGQDLRVKQEAEEHNVKKNFSETQDKYRWPDKNIKDIISPGNDITLPSNSNFDLNIDFTKKNVEDYMKLQEKLYSGYELNDKNIFLPSEIKAEREMKKYSDGFIEHTVSNETQDMLKKYHEYDTNGVLYSKKSGLVKSLFFGHNVDQNKFNHCEYSTTYEYIC
jgi:hypothetical protein